MTSPVMGIDNLTVQGYFSGMATRRSALSKQGGSTTLRRLCGHFFRPVHPRTITIKISNSRSIAVKHAMPQLWHDATWSMAISIVFAVLTGNHIMLTLALSIQAGCQAWYWVSRQRTIRRALIARIQKGR